MENKLHGRPVPTLMKGAFCNPCHSQSSAVFPQEKCDFPGKVAEHSSLKERETVNCELFAVNIYDQIENGKVILIKGDGEGTITFTTDNNIKNIKNFKSSVERRRWKS